VELQPPRLRKSVESLPAGLLTWVVGVILSSTLIPVPGASGHVALHPPTDPVEMLGNVLLLSPVAAILAAVAPGRVVLRSAGAAAALSCCIETAQFAVPGRYMEPYDVVLNTAGAALTAAAIALLRRRGVRSASVLVTTGSLTFVCVLGGLVGSAVFASRMLRMEMWDPNFPVTAGDEATGGRQYAGSVTDARVCAGAPPAPVCAEPGAGPDIRDSIAAAAEASQRLVLSARVISESDTQGGPARIVTFSRDSVLRNTTLGQSDQALVLRVRTYLAGKNGARLVFRLPGAVHRGEPATVSASYSPGAVNMRAESATRLVAAAFPMGVLVSWRLFQPRTVEPDDLRPSAALAALAVFVPVGMALAWGVGPRLLVLASAVTAVMLLGGLEFVLNNAVHWFQLALAACSAAIGALLGWWDRARLTKRRLER
jgi:VanZ family protein